MRSTGVAIGAFALLIAARSHARQRPLAADGSGPQSISGAVLPNNLPDPTVVHYEGVWYVYTTFNKPNPRPHVQLATSSDFESWTLDLIDPLLETGTWSTGNQTWSPSVIQRPDGSWILYYSNPTVVAPNKHCVGAAVSANVAGPFEPVGSKPLICPLAQGGAIDPAAFRDVDGTYWLTYKVDGNSNGHGGACSNGVPPIAPTPIMLQRLGNDLLTFEGSPIQLITNNGPDDGPDVESPSLVRSAEGVYFLFYSSNCFTSPEYNVAYATASKVAGPYTRQGVLLQTGDYGLTAPGGATVDADGVHMVFHANCPQGRCLHTAVITLNGTKASI